MADMADQTEKETEEKRKRERDKKEKKSAENRTIKKKSPAKMTDNNDHVTDEVPPVSRSHSYGNWGRLRSLSEVAILGYGVAAGSGRNSGAASGCAPGPIARGTPADDPDRDDDQVWEEIALWIPPSPLSGQARSNSHSPSPKSLQKNKNNFFFTNFRKKKIASRRMFFPPKKGVKNISVRGYSYNYLYIQPSAERW